MGQTIEDHHSELEQVISSYKVFLNYLHDIYTHDKCCEQKLDLVQCLKWGLVLLGATPNVLYRKLICGRERKIFPVGQFHFLRTGLKLLNSNTAGQTQGIWVLELRAKHFHCWNIGPVGPLFVLVKQQNFNILAYYLGPFFEKWYYYSSKFMW